MEDVKLVCKECGREYKDNERVWKCIKCNGLLDLEYTPEFPLKLIKERKPTLWRYREAIPLNEQKSQITFDEGYTPLLPVEVDDLEVLVKQEQLFSTGSFKDRGASVLVSKVKELGIPKIIEDSSGNAGAAIAAYCAKARISCDIYVPKSTSAGKLVQIEYYGGNLKKIPGTRKDTADAALKAAEKTYYASHSWNPYFFQGTKTFSYEVCEQLGWKAPDTCILPVGNGTLLLGAYIGFKDLQTAGVIEELPEIIGVQTRACAPLFEMFEEGTTQLPKISSQSTLAEGIAIVNPVRSNDILEAIRETNGRIIAVNEDELTDSVLEIAEKGYYIEPTSAITLAGIRQIKEELKEYNTIITAFTGHGLKATKTYSTALVK